MGMRIAVLDDYQDVAREMVDWEQRLPNTNVVFFHDHVADEALLMSRLWDFDVVVCMRERTPMSRQIITGLPRLKLIVTTGYRNAVIDLRAARESGIIVCGTAGLPWSTTELTWGLILALARNIPAEHEAMRNGGWQHTIGQDLRGKTLGIVGLGRLGAQMATIGRAFGMELIAWSPNLTEERAAERGVRYASKKDLFSCADVVSVHMVLAPETRNLIGEEELRLMRSTSFLVNTARGPLVDQAAVIKAMREGWIAGVAFDVYDQEPLPSDHPLRSLPRVILTPHLGYVTRDAYQGFFAHVAEDIQAFQAGAPIRELAIDQS